MKDSKMDNIEQICYLGSRADVWHHKGNEMLPGETVAEWRKKSGLDWTAVKVPALADCSSLWGRACAP